jgi:hypothetical protein
MSSESSALSASLYTAFAEHGVGRPGLLPCHSVIQSRRETGPDFADTSPGWVALVTPKLFWLSDGSCEGVEGTVTFCDDGALKEEERGAKIMMSV